MSESLAGIVAATVPLVIEGKAYNFRPLTIEHLGSSCRRYTDSMLPQLPDPKEAMAAMVGHPKDVVLAVYKELQAERRSVTHPDPLTVVNWIMQSGERIALMLIDCIEGDMKPTVEQLALALDKPEAKAFTDKWMEVSGLQSDPTVPPSGRRKAKKGAAESI